MIGPQRVLASHRRVLASLGVAGIVLLGAAAPASPPDYPVAFISVDELKAHLDGGGRADLIDVRHWDEYVKLHITGARSMPLRSVPERAHEITKTGLAVFY
jgi:rhodanese-like protein